MIKNLLRACRTYPVTAGYLIVAIALFAAVQIYQTRFPQQARDARWKLGAVETLVVVGEPQLVGPLDLWDGQYWRIPVSAFHHGNLMHLVMNGLALAYLGRLLEPRMGRLAYLVFYLFAAVISLVPEFLITHTAIGLSGVAYAIFGVLVVLRRRDEVLAEQFNEGMVRIGFIWLFACVPLTYFKIMNIANLAHFAGFGYGWAAGQVLWHLKHASRWRFPMQFGFYAAHLLLVPAVYLAMHPTWNGSYHWYLAHRSKTPAERIEHWNEAVRRDPGLQSVWKYLAMTHYETGDLPAAWKTILQGLSFNRSYDDGIELSRGFWSQFKTPEERLRALETLAKVFDDEALAWQQRLGIVGRQTGSSNIRIAGADVPLDEPTNPSEYRIDRAIDLSDGSVEVQARDLSAPPVDADSPDSATEGITL